MAEGEKEEGLCLNPETAQELEPLSVPHLMRRVDRELGREEAESILRRGEFGVLCTCGNDGVPYGVPVNYVYDGDSIAFHGAGVGHKVQNMQENACASFTVVTATELLPEKFSTRYESAIAFGRVSLVGGERKRSLLRALVEKYSPAFREKGDAYIRHDADKTSVFELNVVRLRGKAHR